MRLMPSRAAAPLGPPTTHLACRSTSRIRPLSISRKLSCELLLGNRKRLSGLLARSSDKRCDQLFTRGQDYRALDEVLQLSNITRPGYSVRATMVSAGIRSMRLFMRRAYLLTK